MNLKRVYTRLILELDNLIEVSYYKGGIFRKASGKLLSFLPFDYIILKNSSGITQIDFLSAEEIIKEIKSENGIIYDNEYASTSIFTNGIINFLTLQRINIFEYLFTEDFVNRVIQMDNYIAKNSDFKIGDLFFSERQRKEFVTYFKVLYDELKNDSLKDSNLRYLTKGTTSIVYQIGNYIIKIGKPRRCKGIPYCEYLLEPIISSDYYFDDYPIHIEVTNKVKTIKASPDNFKYLIELKNNLKIIGLYSNDLIIDNVGILNKDNQISYHSVHFACGNEAATGIKYNNDLRIKKKGDIVILDLDSLQIIDIDKYLNYLKEIGFSEEQLGKVREDYNQNRMKI